MKRESIIASLLLITTLSSFGNVSLAENSKKDDAKESVKETLVEHDDVYYDEDIEYLLDFQLPNNQKYETLEIYDPIESVFDIQSVKIFVDGKEIPESEGKVEIGKDNRVTWKATNPSNYFSKKLQLRIVVRLKDGAELKDEWKGENGQYKIPNVGHLVLNGEDEPTPEVTVTPPNPEDAVIRKGVGLTNDEQAFKDEVTVEDKESNNDTTFYYRINFNTDSKKKIENVKLVDDLEDVLSVEGVKIFEKGESEKDVTDEQGKLNINDKDSSFEYTFNNYKETIGKKYYAIVQVKVKADEAMEKYKNGTKYTIPNTAYLEQDGDKMESNKVLVHIPLKAVPKKEYPQLGTVVKKNPFATLGIAVMGIGAVYYAVQKRGEMKKEVESGEQQNEE